MARTRLRACHLVHVTQAMLHAHLFFRSNIFQVIVNQQEVLATCSINLRELAMTFQRGKDSTLRRSMNQTAIEATTKCQTTHSRQIRLRSAQTKPSPNDSFLDMVREASRSGWINKVSISAIIHRIFILEAAWYWSLSNGPICQIYEELS